MESLAILSVVVAFAACGVSALNARRTYLAAERERARKSVDQHFVR